jgi:hypothetical protein
VELHKKFPFLIHILIVCVAILVMRSVSEKRQISHLYFLFFIIGLFGFMFVGLDFGANTYAPDIFKGAVLVVISIALIYGMFQANSNESSNAVYMTNKVLGLVGLMIPLVALGMVYNKFAPDIDEITNSGGISGFFVLFLFYIPCLISDFADYLKAQFRLTPSATYLLLGLEILLILAFVYLPRLLVSKRDVNLLLKEAFLDEPKVIASSADIFSRDDTPRSCSFSMWIYTNQQPQKQDCNIFRYGSVSDGERTPKYNLNTRLRDEMTIEEVKQEILAATPLSYVLDDKSDDELKTKFREIALGDEEYPIDIGAIQRQLNDGYKDETDIDVLKNEYKSKFKIDNYPVNRSEIIKKIQARDGNALNFIQKKRETLMQELSSIYDAQTQVKPQIKYISSSNGNDNFRIIYNNDKSDDVSIRSQKWNNFVITYDGTQVDLFVNGNLERSEQLDAPVRYSPLDQMVVGDENGIDGAICNVCFYPKPMTSSEVAQSYNLLSSKNPPINV